MSMSIRALSRSRLRAVVSVAGALALAACGGGGGGGDAGSGDSGAGGTLEVSLSYQGGARLFQQSTISPTLTGLQGHSPDCSLASGTLPNGMSLSADCTISGTPLQSGTFPIVVRLGAAGVSNRLDWNASVLVSGPSVTYSVPSTMMAGAQYDLAPLNTILWTPTAADVVTYSVAEGSLPPGLTVDASTGHIAGTPTAAGTYSFKIGAQVVNAGRTATAVEQFPEVTTVNQPVIAYNYVQGRAGLAFSATPLIPGGSPVYTFSAATLPPGLAIDATTGVISGTPTALADATYRINLTAAAAGGGTYTTFTDVPLSVQSPVFFYWSTSLATHGVPFSSQPVIQSASADPLTGISYTYAVDAASSLPAGFSLDATTGKISGTTSATGSFTVRIDVTITLYGTTFVVPVDVALTVS